MMGAAAYVRLMRAGTQRRAVRDGTVLAMLLFAGAYALTAPGLAFFYDARSWWGIDPASMYAQAMEGLTGVGAFRYSPAIGLAMVPFGWLPWSVFITGWTVMLAGVTVAMRPGRWWALLLYPFTILELTAGNVHLLMAAAVVFGFRWPALWAFMALTKVTPFVGVLWFAFRGEWRAFAIALGATAGIVAVGWAIAPDLWAEWIRSLAVSAGRESLSYLGPLWLRLPLAVAVTWYAARTDRRWLLPVAVTFALPNIWLHGFAVTAAAVALWGHQEAPAR